MAWREADLDECLLLHDMHGTKHDALDERVHGEAFDLCPFEECMLHPVSQHEGGRMEEQAEVVRLVGAARHAVCLEVLRGLYPQFHLAASAILAVDGPGRVVPVLGHHELDVRAFRRNLYLGDDALSILPALRLVLQLVVSPDDDALMPDAMVSKPCKDPVSLVLHRLCLATVVLGTLSRLVHMERSILLAESPVV